MFKFFRKIRAQMMSQGKGFQYFKYAIGEIILVVIGILIALSINNWNENRKNTLAEQSLLNDLKTEVNENIAELEIIIHEHEISLETTETIQALLQDPIRFNQTPDSVVNRLFRRLGYNWTFNPKLGILNSNINSGKIDLIQNKELKNKLSSLVEIMVDTYESTDRVERLRDRLYYPLMMKRDIADLSSITFDNRKLMKDPQYLVWSQFVKVFRTEGLVDENNLMDYLLDLRRLIESEIKT